ncbi:MAG: 50S ribosomal protein L25/general stress protein Ctc [Proteobacteria bacterium]|nr:50S ribosomal protein L25/general stress protein Ctc [Pseudomonadota bacterium]
MTTAHTLPASMRTVSGKGAARAARRDGMVPAVIYGAGKEPQIVSVHAQKLEVMMGKGGFYTNVLELDMGKDKIKVLPREVQLHPVRDEAIHVDFLRFDPKAEVKVMVAVHILDEELSPGVKIGGLVQMVRPEVELWCRADSIPQFVEASVAGLEIGDSVHISSVKLPDGVTPTVDRDFTIATIVSTRVSQKSEAEDGAEGETASAEGEGASEE